MFRNTIFATAVAAALSFTGTAHAAQLMPNLADVPTGWFTDRYEPHSFSNVGTMHGRTNVLGVEINDAEAFNNRPAPFQSTFYNTQGRQHLTPGGIGDSLSAGFYVESSWADDANGNRRGGLWAVLTDGIGNITAYGILDITNYGGDLRLRWWDSTTGLWNDIMTLTGLDNWFDLGITLTPTEIQFSLGGVQMASDTTLDGSVEFSAAILNFYNFGGDPSIPDAVAGPGLGDYSYLVSNVPAAAVPEPSSLLLMLAGLLGIVGVRRLGVAVA